MATAARRHEMVGRILRALGWLGILAGLGIFTYSFFVVRPRIAAVPGELTRDIHDLDSSLGTLEQSGKAIRSSFQDADQWAASLPVTLLTLQGTLDQVYMTLESSADTANQVKKGVTGLVLPKKQLGLDDTSLRRSAEQLHLLAAMVGQLRADSSHLSGGASRLFKQLEASPELVREGRSRIQDLSRAIDYSSLPNQAALLGTALAGMYCFLGIFSFALALIYEQAAGRPKSVSTGAWAMDQRAA